MTGEQIYSMSDELVDAVNDLNDEIDADFNHGAGFGTKKDRDEFIEYFDEKFKNVADKYEGLKKELNSM